MEQIRVGMGVGRSLALGTLVMGVIAISLPLIVEQSSLAQLPKSNQPRGSKINGKLDSNSHILKEGSYVNLHEFTGIAGEKLTIDLSSKEFDAYLVLVDPDKNKIAENDNVGSRTDSRIIISLSKTGVYTLVVTNRSLGRGGNYELSWRETSATDIELAKAEQLHQQAVQQYNQGHYVAASPLSERALTIREKVLGPDHPDVAHSLNKPSIVVPFPGEIY